MHECTEVAVFSGIEYQMPMVWHNDIRQYPHIHQLFRFKQKFLENPVVCLNVKNPVSSVGAVDYVINLITDIDSGVAWHGEYIVPYFLSKNGGCPCFLVFLLVPGV